MSDEEDQMDLTAVLDDSRVWNEHIKRHDQRGLEKGALFWQVAADLLNDADSGPQDIEAAKVYAQLAAIAFDHPVQLSEGLEQVASRISTVTPQEVDAARQNATTKITFGGQMDPSTVQDLTGYK